MCNWTPELLVELVKVSAWPLVVLILGLGFRIKFSEAIKDFLSRNSISHQQGQVLRCASFPLLAHNGYLVPKADISGPCNSRYGPAFGC